MAKDKIQKIGSICHNCEKLLSKLYSNHVLCEDCYLQAITNDDIRVQCEEIR